MTGKRVCDLKPGDRFTMLLPTGFASRALEVVDVLPGTDEHAGETAIRLRANLGAWNVVYQSDQYVTLLEMP